MADRARIRQALKRALGLPGVLRPVWLQAVARALACSRNPLARVTRRRLTTAAALLLAASLSWNATALNLGGDRPTVLAATAFMTPLSGDRLLVNTEGLLVRSLLEITEGHTQVALDTLDELLRHVPNFKLAHLIKGDLLSARARELTGFGAATGAPDETITDFREEARVRIQHYLDQKQAHTVPPYIWQLDKSQQYVIVVDTTQSRLYLYRNEQGQPRYVADYYVTIGKNGSEKHKEGDKRTPLGVYFAGTQLKQKLPDLYGTAAFPLNYPNEWDQQLGKDGYGIWLHGTPSDTYSRPPRASDGCVVLTNPDIQELKPILDHGATPVIITNGMTPTSGQQEAQEKLALMNTIEAWRTAWESQRTDDYLQHYSRDFFWKGRGYDQWASEKRRIQSGQPPVSVTLSNISVFRYPDTERIMAVVTFDQDYKSRLLSDHMRKRQYWILEDNRWKILYEGAA